MTVFPEGLEPERILEPASWVREWLKDWPAGGFRVRDLVPPVFDAYARILHRAQTEDGGGSRTKTWAQRAAELGRSLGPETTWSTLIGSTAREVDRDPWLPDEGRLSGSEVGTLTSFLSPASSDPSACWFALWAGWGFLGERSSAELRPVRGGRIGEPWARRRALGGARRSQQEFAHHATFELFGGSGRSYLLFGGALDDATRFRFEGWFQSPTLWWPDDRSWFLHTEIDGMSTYLGGTRETVDRLVDEQPLESFEVHEDMAAAL
jgi:hypothetical protein